MKPLTTWGETPAALPGEPLSGSTTDSHIFLKAKFLLCAGFGLFMFLRWLQHAAEPADGCD